MTASLVALFGLMFAATVWSFSGHPRPAVGADWAWQRFQATTFFGGLNGLRAASVLAVIWYHVSGVHDFNLLNHGNKGVSLFFGISGFLVTTLMLRERRRTGTVSLRGFYVRRTLRIFPLYYAVLALYCVLVALTFNGSPKAAEFWANLPAFLTYTSNWFVSADNAGQHGVTFYFAWSLATEEQFYLFWPPLLLLVLRWTGSKLAGAATALALVALQMLAAQHGGTFLATVAGSLAAPILFGAAFALLLDEKAVFVRLYPVLGHDAAAPASLVLLLALLQFDQTGVFTQFVIAFFVASVCVREDTVLHPALAWKPADYVGSISYGVYLMHMLAVNGVRRVVGHVEGVDIFVLTALVTIALAGLSFRYFEQPVLGIRRRWTRAAPAAATPTPASPTGGLA